MGNRTSSSLIKDVKERIRGTVTKVSKHRKTPVFGINGLTNLEKYTTPFSGSVKVPTRFVHLKVQETDSDNLSTHRTKGISVLKPF